VVDGHSTIRTPTRAGSFLDPVRFPVPACRVLIESGPGARGGAAPPRRLVSPWHGA